MKNAFLITILSGSSTMLGTLPIFWNFKEKNINSFIVFSLSIAISLMVGISIFELIIPSVVNIANNNTLSSSIITVISTVIISSFIINLIIKFIDNQSGGELFKIGILNMIILIIHNLPEGYTQNVSQSKPLKNKEKNLNLQMKRKAFDKVFLFLNQKP